MNEFANQRFGDYKLIQSLGEGYFGEVYKAEHVINHASVAVKVFKRLPDTEDFLREASAVFLEHPHIVKVVGFGINDKKHSYIAMKYTPNGTLRGRHPGGSRLPLSTIVTYVNQIASALQYAHEQRWVHRDIKPENILVGPDGEIWVGDFGIAVSTHREGSFVVQNGTGTPEYRPPEQRIGNAVEASDQYALGIMVYEWLCGERPFYGNTVQLEYQHKEVFPPSLRTKYPNIPPEIEQVVMRALAKNPADRFPGVMAFAEALERACSPVDMKRIALFGYETDGGRNSILWNNPEAFSSNSQYKARYEEWSKTKRKFTKDEVLNGTWVKVSEHGNSFIVQLSSDGQLKERSLFGSDEESQGKWSLENGILKLCVGEYELSVFANSDSPIHSGVEYKQGLKDPWAYFKVIHAQRA